VIKTTSPPPVRHKRLLIIPYTYVTALIVLILWQLIMLSTFTLYLRDYLGTGATTAATLAILLIGIEVFSVPFLLRLHLSPLARFCSAILAFATPLAWIAVITAGNSFNVMYLLINIVIFLWGGLSFWVLGGPKAMHLHFKAA